MATDFYARRCLMNDYESLQLAYGTTMMDYCVIGLIRDQPWWVWEIFLFKLWWMFMNSYGALCRMLVNVSELRQTILIHECKLRWTIVTEDRLWTLRTDEWWGQRMHEDVWRYVTLTHDVLWWGLVVGVVWRWRTITSFWYMMNRLCSGWLTGKMHNYIEWG